MPAPAFLVTIDTEGDDLWSHPAQVSTRNARLDMIDPDNRLYARQSLRRIDSESLRDAVLVVSGKYSNQMFGPPIPA